MNNWGGVSVDGAIDGIVNGAIDGIVDVWEIFYGWIQERGQKKDNKKPEEASIQLYLGFCHGC